MPDYTKSKIYKIVGGGLTYIGSTTQTLVARFRGHKVEKQSRPLKKCAAFQLLDYDDCKIELLEEYPCNNNNELRERERYWFENIENINKIKPLRTEDEKKEYHKLYNTQYIRKDNYYKNNRERTLLRMKEKVVCECGCSIKKGNLKDHQQTKKHLEKLNSQSIL